jgi:HK97 family phage major capsid protein
MNEQLKAIFRKLADMKKIENTGFSDPAKAAEYFQDKEILLEEMAKALETVATNSTVQVEQLEKTVKSLREELKGQAANPRELTQKELYYKLGRGIAALSRGSQTILSELGYSPNFGDTNWTNPKDVNWVMGKGWIERAAIGSPMGDMTTPDQFLIHPSYETELVSIAEKKSVMMSLVDSNTMTTASRFIPVEEDTETKLEWLVPYGKEIPEVEQPKIENVELKVLTCAGYIRFYDEFEEDSFIDLGKLFVKKFTGSYAKEYDKQCLTANEDPFTGALRTDRAVNFPIKGSTIKDLTWEDFDEAIQKVPAEERNNCCWFLHESLVYHVMKIKDKNGNPILRHPLEKMPGVIGQYPYRECHIMPQLSEVGANTPFAVFINPLRINHGDRKGIELKRFAGTSESLKYGTQALRFRKRDAFSLVIPKNHMVILKTKAQ